MKNFATAKRLKTGAVGLAGLVAGGVLAGTLSATAANTDSGTRPTTAPDDFGGRYMGQQADPSQPQRADEELLSDDIAAKVKAAALAEYPGATVVRVESDSDGVYEAHLTKADGTPVTVEVDKSFQVTAEEQPGHGGFGGPGERGGDHHGDHHGHGMPGGQPPMGSDDDQEGGGTT